MSWSDGFPELLRLSSKISRQPMVVSAVVAVAMIIVVIFVWQLEKNDQNSRVKAELRSSAIHIAAQLEAHISTRLGMGEHIRQHWMEGNIKNKQDFIRHTAGVHELFGDFQAINWIDPQGVIRWVTPEKGNAAALGLKIRSLSVPSVTLAEAERTGTWQLSPPITLAQGGYGFVAYTPVANDGAKDGFINIVFRTAPLINSALNKSASTQFQVIITDDGKIVFNTGNLSDEFMFQVDEEMKVGNRNWKVSVMPSEAARHSASSVVDELVLGVGIIVSLATAYLIWLVMVRQRIYRNSDELFRATFGQEVLGMTLGSVNLMDTKRWDVNQKFCDILGYTRDELMKLSAVDITAPEDRQSTLEFNERLQSGQVKSYSREKRFLHKNGKVIWAEIWLSTINDGEQVKTITVIQDISQRKQAEEALKLSEARFKDFADSASDWFWETNAEMQLSYLSDNYSAITGGRQDAVLGKTRADLIDKDSLSPSWTAHLVALENHEPFRDFEYFHNPDIDIPLKFWLRTSGIPIFDDTGDFVGYRGSASDISGIKNAENAEREIQEQFSAFVEYSPSCIIIKDTEGGILHANTRWHRYFNPDGKNVYGKTVFDLFPEKYSTPINEQEKQVVAQSAYIEQEMIAPLADGTLMPALLQKFPIKNDEGEVVAIGGIILDITERKHLEKRLQRSQRMEAVGQLTGGVAHDFNNLLAAMIGNTELLESRLNGDDAARHNVEALMQAIERAAALTDRLLAFSRQQTLSPVSTNVTNLINGLEDMLRRTLGVSVELNIEKSENIWSVMIDPHQFENALVNLAINARDAMVDGGVLAIKTSNIVLSEAFCEFAEGVEPGDYVKVQVSDTGVGIPPEDLDKVFEPFFTTKEIGKGSGLGLSMVFGFVNQSNGHVAIRSELGRGTNIDLFMQRSEKEEVRKKPSVMKTGMTQGVESVLVVEDDLDVREIPVSILQEQGYEIVEAANGKNAIEELKARSFDLLFTDMILPGGIYGVEIANEAKRLHPNIKVLFTTGYAENSIERFGKFDSDVTLIRKPYRRADLLEKVRGVLDSASE